MTGQLRVARYLVVDVVLFPVDLTKAIVSGVRDIALPAIRETNSDVTITRGPQFDQFPL